MPEGDAPQGESAKPDRAPRRGQLYWIAWEPARGTEKRGRRPGLIVQADPINASRAYRNTIALAVTTADHRVPTHVQIEPGQENGLPKRSYVMCEHVMTISRERLDGYIGVLDEATIDRVDRAMKRALGLR